jgi:hypothetical protein
MTISTMAATVAFAVAAAAVTLGAGAGFAQADPPGPPWDPGPLPPGQGYLPPPGHRADIDGVVPVWAPPAPPPPPWAPWLPVVWNADLLAWGVWWNGGFIQL